MYNSLRRQLFLVFCVQDSDQAGRETAPCLGFDHLIKRSKKWWPHCPEQDVVSSCKNHPHMMCISSVFVLMFLVKLTVVCGGLHRDTATKPSCHFLAKPTGKCLAGDRNPAESSVCSHQKVIHWRTRLPFTPFILSRHF